MPLLVNNILTDFPKETLNHIELERLEDSFSRNTSHGKQFIKHYDMSLEVIDRLVA